MSIARMRRFRVAQARAQQHRDDERWIASVVAEVCAPVGAAIATLEDAVAVLDKAVDHD